MKKILVAATFSLSAALPAHASGFEFCDLGGEVRAAAKSGDGYTLTVMVSDAARAKQDGELSYTDCTGYAGKAMTVTLALPRGQAVPEPGDHIAFSRSRVDGFNADGQFTGTSEKTQFVRLRKKSP